MLEDIGGVLGRRDFVVLEIDGDLDAYGLVKGRPAKARGALNLDMSDSKVE